MSQLGLKYYVPEFEIIFDGARMVEMENHVINFQITEQLQAPAEFSFTLSDKFDVKTQKFKWLDEPKLQPGKSKISLKIGYVNKVTEIISKGMIKSITTSGFSQNDAPSVTITGYDATHDWLSKTPEIKDGTTSLELTGSEAAKIVAKGAGYESQIKVQGKEYPTKVTKSSETNYGAIIKERAESIGYEFFSSRGVFHFLNLRKLNSSNHTYEWGQNLIQFAPSVNTTEIVTGVKICSMPPNSRTKIIGEAFTGQEETIESGTTASEFANSMSEKKEKEINDDNFATKEEADAKAHAVLNIIGDTFVTGSGSVVGNPDIEIGHIITLNKIGQFSGKYHVTKVIHSISDAGYITQFDVRRNVIGGTSVAA